MLKPKVQQAIDELRHRFAESAVLHQEDGEGGAYVTVDPVDLGPRFTEATRSSWIGFRITCQYPFADVYPHFVRPDLHRADGQPHGPGVSGPTQFVGVGRAALQLSRRSNHRDPDTETAVLKLLKVLVWMRQGP